MSPGHGKWGPSSWSAPGQQHEAGGRAAPREGPTLALPGAFSSSPRQELDGPRSFLESSASFQPRGKRCCGARARSQPRGTSRPGRGWPPGADGRTDTRTGAFPGLAAARLGATTAARAAFSPWTPTERTPHAPIEPAALAQDPQETPSKSSATPGWIHCPSPGTARGTGNANHRAPSITPGLRYPTTAATPSPACCGGQAAPPIREPPPPSAAAPPAPVPSSHHQTQPRFLPGHTAMALPAPGCDTLGSRDTALAPPGTEGTNGVGVALEVPGRAAGSSQALPVMLAGTVLPAAASPHRYQFLGSQVSVHPQTGCHGCRPPQTLPPQTLPPCSCITLLLCHPKLCHPKLCHPKLCHPAPAPPQTPPPLSCTTPLLCHPGALPLLCRHHPSPLPAHIPQPHHNGSQAHHGARPPPWHPGRGPGQGALGTPLCRGEPGGPSALAASWAGQEAPAEPLCGRSLRFPRCCQRLARGGLTREAKERLPPNHPRHPGSSSAAQGVRGVPRQGRTSETPTLYPRSISASRSQRHTLGTDCVCRSWGCHSRAHGGSGARVDPRNRMGSTDATAPRHPMDQHQPTPGHSDTAVVGMELLANTPRGPHGVSPRPVGTGAPAPATAPGTAPARPCHVATGSAPWGLHPGSSRTKGPAMPPSPSHRGDPHPCPQRGHPGLQLNPDEPTSPAHGGAPSRLPSGAAGLRRGSPQLFLALDAARSRRPGNGVPGTARPQTALSGSATAGRQVQPAAPAAWGRSGHGTRGWRGTAQRAGGSATAPDTGIWWHRAPGSGRLQDRVMQGWDLGYPAGAKPPPRRTQAWLRKGTQPCATTVSPGTAW
ncbi:proline-rich protein 36-like [Lathamus discolor]|uniref:proline-rich protein 36-like n=1 Tax=Lathamus discolor TaxID=678569 RepID=UPI0032B747F3